jgi:hypothetical protein
MPAKLDLNMSNARLRGLLTGHMKLVAADAQTSDLGPGVAGIRESLKTSGRALGDALDEEAGAMALAIGQDEHLDATSKQFADALFNACGRRREDPRYKAALPKGQLDLTQPRLWDQRAKFDQYLPNLTRLAERDPIVAEFLPRMREGRENLSTSLDGLKTASDAVAAARWTERTARMAAVAMWDSNYGELMGRFPGDRARVESFFPRVRYHAPAEAAETEPEPEPAAPVTDDAGTGPR